MNSIHNISRIFPDSACILNKELQIFVHKYIYDGIKSTEVLMTANPTLHLFCVTVNNSIMYVYFMLSVCSHK